VLASGEPCDDVHPEGRWIHRFDIADSCLQHVWGHCRTAQHSHSTGRTHGAHQGSSSNERHTGIDEGNLQSVLLCDACLQHEVLQSSTNRIARRKLAILEQQLGKTPFSGGHRWNMADFMVACGLYVLTRLKLDLAAYPRLDDWLTAGAGG
jgi:glutathione S-transferase